MYFIFLEYYDNYRLLCPNLWTFAGCAGETLAGCFRFAGLLHPIYRLAPPYISQIYRAKNKSIDDQNSTI